MITTPSLLSGLCLLGAASLAASPEPASSNPCTPWPATDAIGRRLPTPAEVGPPKPGRFVGIFYFLWHDNAQKPGDIMDAYVSGDAAPAARFRYRYEGE